MYLKVPIILKANKYHELMLLRELTFSTTYILNIKYVNFAFRILFGIVLSLGKSFNVFDISLRTEIITASREPRDQIKSEPTLFIEGS